MGLKCVACHVVVGTDNDNVAWWSKNESDDGWSSRCLACESLRSPPWLWRLELEPAAWTCGDGSTVYKMHQEKELAI
jgi:hypothetical protein